MLEGLLKRKRKEQDEDEPDIERIVCSVEKGDLVASEDGLMLRLKHDFGGKKIEIPAERLDMRRGSKRPHYDETFLSLVRYDLRGRYCVVSKEQGHKNIITTPFDRESSKRIREYIGISYENPYKES